MEEWQETTFGNYKINRVGEVKNAKGKTRKPYCDKDGYLGIILYHKGKKQNLKIHRLVGFAFMKDAYFEGATIDHVNGIKDDNQVENLEWVTNYENIRRAYAKGSHEKNKKKIKCNELGTITLSAEEMAHVLREKGVITSQHARHSITRVARGERKSYHGYTFEYMEEKNE
jgi:hypothetical protein